MSAARGSRLPAACDAHCHLHDERFRQQLPPDDASDSRSNAATRLELVMQRAAAANVTHVVACACHEQDWATLERLLVVQQAACRDCPDGDEEQLPAMTRPLILPAFGLHPWWASEHDNSMLVALRQYLERYPTASLGEIGLCKSARGRQTPLGVQEEAMRAQLSLAAELGRTCVIHCVGYYGKLLELLAEQRSRLPPRIVLHSYSGSPEMLSVFLTLSQPPTTEVFVSLNARQLADTRSNKAATCCATVPISALLLETDAPDQPPTLEAVQSASTQFDIDVVDALRVGDTLLAAGLNEPLLVQLAVQRAAQIRAMNVHELAETVYANSQRAFGF